MIRVQCKRACHCSMAIYVTCIHKCTWWLYIKTCREPPTSPYEKGEVREPQIWDHRYSGHFHDCARVKKDGTISEDPCASSMFLFHKSTLTYWTLTSTWKIFQVTIKKPLKLLAETNPERYITSFHTGGPKSWSLEVGFFQIIRER